MAIESSVFPDKVGRPLKPGDLIIYGHALGRCASLQYGKVLGVLPGKPGHASKLKVQGVRLNDNWNHQSGRTSRDAYALRASTLQYPSRVLKVTKSQIPPQVLKVLKKIEIPTEQLP